MSDVSLLCYVVRLIAPNWLRRFYGILNDTDLQSVSADIQSITVLYSRSVSAPSLSRESTKSADISSDDTNLDINSEILDVSHTSSLECVPDFPEGVRIPESKFPAFDLQSINEALEVEFGPVRLQPSSSTQLQGREEGGALVLTNFEAGIVSTTTEDSDVVVLQIVRDLINVVLDELMHADVQGTPARESNCGYGGMAAVGNVQTEFLDSVPLDEDTQIGDILDSIAVSEDDPDDQEAGMGLDGASAPGTPKYSHHNE